MDGMFLVCEGAVEIMSGFVGRRRSYVRRVDDVAGTFRYLGR